MKRADSQIANAITRLYKAHKQLLSGAANSGAPKLVLLVLNRAKQSIKLLLFGVIIGFAQQGFAQTVVLTNPTSPWTVPAGVTSIKVEVWGGGGAGGGCDKTFLASYGSGGGGGAYNVSTFTVSPGQTYSITKGAGGTASSDANGTNGTASSVSGPGGSVSAAPGFGGGRRGGTAGTGGSGTFNGGNGGTATDQGAGGGGGAGNLSAGSAGANNSAGAGGTGSPNSSPYIGGSGGANRGFVNGRGNGYPGTLPSGGGGGGYQYTNSGAKSGGAGAAGQVVITYTVGPIITSLSPSNGCVGSSLIITGTNLLNATSVTIGGTAAAIMANTATSVTVTVGSGTTGNISITTAGGTATSSSTFTVNQPPTVVTVSGGGSLCSSATLTASGGNGGTIYWQGTNSNGTSTTTPSTSQVVTASGTYYFRALSSGGCWGQEGSATVTIFSAAPIASFSASTTTITAGGNITFTDNSINSPTSWSWSFPGGSPSTSNAQNPTITYNTVGYYNVTMTSTNVCGSNSLTQSNYISATNIPSANTFTTPGTFSFTPPACVSRVTVECWGGGGKGGSWTSDASNGGGGGGGGAYSKKVVPVISNTPYTITVGAGSSSTSPGGDSWFGSNTTVLAKGGNSVADNNATGGTGGATSPYSDVSYSGGNGAAGSGGSYGGGGGSSAGISANGVNATNRNGATAPSGGGPGGTGGQYLTDAIIGNSPGGGGGGGYRYNLFVWLGGNGFAGAPGQVRITYAVDVPPSITGHPSTTTQSHCLNSTATTLSVTATGEGLTYQWYSNTTASNTGGSPVGTNSSSYTPSTTTAGTLYYYCIVSGTCTPAAISNVSGGVTVNAFPAAPSAANNGPVCIGHELRLTASDISGATYAWTGPNAFASTSQNPTVSASATTAMSGVYSVTATVNGCTGPAGQTTVTVNTPPVAPTVGNNSPVCVGGTLWLTASTISGASYAWTGPNGYISSEQNPTVSTSTTANLAGTYSVTATVNGCTGPAGTTSVAVNTLPVAYEVTGGGSYCAGGSGVNINLSNSDTDINYDLYKNSVATGTTLPGTGSALTFTNVTTEGTYTVVATRTSGNCIATMTGSASVTATPNTPVSVSIVSDPSVSVPVCAGATITFTATPVNGGTTPVYQWYKNGGVINEATSATYAVNNLVNGDQINCVLTPANTITCPSAPNVSSNTLTLTVKPRPTAHITSVNTNLCAPGSTDITMDVVATGTWNLTYKNGAGSFSGPGTGHFTNTVSPTSTTTYEVLSLQDDNNCVSEPTDFTGATEVSVSTKPLIKTIAQTKKTVCSPTTVDLSSFIVSVTPLGTPITYWTDDPTPIQLTGTEAAAINESGSYTIKATTGPDCFDAKTVEVVINTPHSCDFDGLWEVPATSNQVYTAPGGMKSYAWSVIDGLSGPIADIPGGIVDAQTVTISNNWIGLFTLELTITDQNDCSNTCSRPINVGKSSQTITFDELSPKTYGDAPYDITTLGTSDSTLPISYTSSNPAVASITDDYDWDNDVHYYTVHIIGAGTTSITASQGGSELFLKADDVTQVLTVNKKVLTVTADPQTKVYGAENPTLTFSYSGFLNGDDADDLNTKPVAGTTVDLLSAVGTHTGAITVAGGVDENYAFTYIPADFEVTQAMLTVTADPQTKVYGAENPTLTFSYSGFLNGDDADDLTTKPVAGTTVDLLSAVGTHTGAITVAGGVDENYAFTYIPADFEVTQAMLTVTADPQTKVYGAENPTLTFSYNGFLNGDDESVLNTKPVAGTTVDLLSAVGTHTGAITVAGGVDENYAFTYIPADFEVTQAMLTVTADPQTKVYGAENPTLTFSYNGFLNGDDADDLTTKPVAGTTVDLLSAVGTHTGAITVAGGVDNNYAFTYIPADFEIAQAMLTVTADPQTKVYGAENPTLTFSYSGFLNGEDADDLTTKPEASTTFNLLSAVGTHTGAITVAGGVDENYAFTYIPADFEVTQAMLTVTADPQTKVYGAENPTLTFSYNGFLNGEDADDLNTKPVASTTVDLLSAVGTHTGAITVAGGVDENYAFTYIPADFEVTQAMLTVTADPQTKVYGAENPTLTFSYNGFLNGEDESVLNTKPVAGTTVDLLSAVGTHTGAITVAGGVDENYAFTYIPADFEVTQAMLTVTADPQTKVYGAENPTLTFSYNGFLNGEDADDLNTKPVASTTVDLLSAVGTHTGAITVAGGVDENYAFTYIPADFEVTQAMLTVTADPQTKVYGAENPTLTFSYNGFLNGEDESVLNTKPVAGTTVDLLSAVGTHTGAITVAGGVDENYAFTYIPADFEVTQAMLTVTADPQTKVYGAENPTLTFSYNGFLNGDDADDLTTKPVAGTTVDLLSAVGTHTGAITVAGGVDNNYAFTYIPADFEIAQAMLTVTADPQTKVYGAENPTLTFSYSGFLNGDDADDLTTKPEASTTVNLLSAVGTHTGAITVAGGVDENYAFTYIPADFEVTQAMLTVTADPQTKVYGAENPTLTFSYNGFLNGDDESVLNTKPVAGTTVDLLSAVGTHTGAITVAGGVDNNYAFTYIPADFEIAQAMLTVTADPQTKVYGAENPTLTFSYNGFLNGDDESVLNTKPVAGTTVDLLSAVGTHTGAITVAGGVDENYAFTYIAADFEVTQAMLTVTADPQTKVYGAENPTLTFSYSGFLNGDDADDLTTKPEASTTVNLLSAVGTHTGAITVAGGVDENYAFTYIPADFEVTAKQITVTADNKIKECADALDPPLTYTYIPELIGTDVFSGSLTREAGENIGQYDIQQGSLILSTNYTLIFNSAKLVISDKIPPVVITKNITVQLDASGQVSITAAQVDNGSSDACGTISMDVSPNSFTCANVGANTVILTVTDNGGNTVNKTAVITVEDKIKPVITTCPASISNLHVPEGECTANNIDVGIPVATDNCGVASIIGLRGDGGDILTSGNHIGNFPVGTTTIIWSVTDIHANISTCLQTVTVIGIQPTITCGAPVIVNADPGICSARITSIPEPTSAQACAIVDYSAARSDNPTLLLTDPFDVGTTTITWYALGANSVIVATCTQTVTVKDNQPPTINCPADIATVTNTGCTATGVDLGSPTTGDNCGVKSVTNNAPDEFPLGETTVVWTVTDNSNNTATCDQKVIVTDNVPPTINCPADIATFTNTGCTATGVDLGSPTTGDNCGVKSVTNNAPEQFPLGETTVVWTVTDNSNNTATCDQKVIVTDNVPPTINCPADIATFTNTGCTATGVDLGSPTTGDNCGVKSVTNNAPDEFPLGETTVVWTVTDNSNNTATCDQKVIVTDNVPPTINCPADIATFTNTGCTATGVDLGSPTTGDNCGVKSATNNAPDEFPLGETTVVWTVTDNSNNTATCDQKVIVTDNVPPTINCPADIATVTNTGCTATGVDLGAPTTGDNCGVKSATNNAPEEFPLGETTVVWTVTDNSNNTATCDQKVIVTDNVPPTINCPADIATFTNTGCTATGVDLGSPTTGDNCGVKSVINNAPEEFPLGETTVVWTVTDNSNNTATCDQKVIVTDNVPPTINCPADIATFTNTGCTATGVDLGTPTTGDNCGVKSVTNNAPEEFPLGETTVVWTVTDNSNNTATCDQKVIVTDNEKPKVFTKDITVNLSSNSVSIAASDVNNGSTDNCGIASLTVSPNSFTCANLGTNIVTLTVADTNGNSETATAIVTVKDITAPVISCPPNITVPAASGQCNVPVSVGTATATDNCTIFTIIGTRSDGQALNVAYPIGITTITWTATDLSANYSTCQQTVTVTSNTIPVITCPHDIIVNSDTGLCTAIIQEADLGTATLTNSCGPTSIIKIRSDYESLSDPYPLGNTTIIWTALDAFYNPVASCSQKVTVVDKQAPVISNCPSDITVYSNEVNPLTCSQIVSWTEPSATDNCDGEVTVNRSNDPGATFPEGTTTVTYTFTDAANNSSTCAFNVTVVDNTIPTITCQDDIETCFGETITIVEPVVNDNCGIKANGLTGVRSDNLTLDAIYPIGQTSISWTVTDIHDNINTCIQTVTVYELPVAGITSDGTVLTCAIQSINLTATGGGTYSWSNDLGTNANVIITAPGTYTVTVTSANGCTDSESITITQDNNVPSVIITNPQPVCNPATVDLTALEVTSGSTEGLLFSYWTNSLATMAYATPAEASAGTYFIKGTTSGGCYAIQAVTVTVNPVIVASLSINVNQNNVNPGTPVTFTATPIGGGTSPAYQWFKNAIAVASGITYTYVPANGDVVYAVMTSSLECVNGSPATSNAITMAVNQEVVASVSISASDNNVCAGIPVTFTATPVNGGTSPTYVWYLNNVAVHSGVSGTYVPTNGDAIYVVMTSNLPSVTGSPATSNSVTMVVNQAPAGTVTISANQNNVSPGTPVTFTATSVGGGTSPTYTWYLNNVAVSTGSSGTYVPTNGDVVYAKMTPDLPCSDGSMATSNSITMIVNQGGAASVSISASQNNVCAGTPVTFTATPVNGGASPTYLWYLNNVAFATGPSGTYVPHNGDKVYVVMTSSLSLVTGSPATSNMVTIVVNTLAAQPAYFTEGMAYVTKSQSNVRYTVPYVAGVTYIWNYSGTGATITGTSNSVLISFSGTATSGTLSVRASNSCGTSAPRSGFITVGTTLKAGIISDVIEPATMDATPAKIELKVYPNPASGPVTFEFMVTVDAKVTIDIFSISGKQIARIFNTDVEANVSQTVIFDEPLSSGVYPYVLKWNDQVVTGKLIKTM